MRILRIAQNLYPEVPGGGTYHVHAMSRDQAAMGHDITVLTVSDDESLPRREQRDGYTVVRRPSSIKLLGNAISLSVARFLRETSTFDVIHAHSHLYFSTNLSALKRWCSDVPLVITNHGLYSQNAPEWLFDLYLRSLGRWTFNRADVVFCYTEEDRTRLEEFGVNSRIETVANGVDTERFTAYGPKSDLIDHDGLVVLFVGRLVDGKRPGDAIQAVSQLPDALDAKLYVIGDGPLREELETGNDGVAFLGHISYDEMPAIYRSGDVLLLPSRAEGLPRTVLEAFASGVPVVSSHLEHTAPIVQAGGETVQVGDVTAYSEQIEKVIDNRSVYAKRGCRMVLEKFQWQGTVDETTRILREVGGDNFD
jgi:glycosyltransferase involved in cell wall biosynthesis